tara:strand:+ start:366 stop:764 length:399 start_codon:yes stop_codon:yes gene_type:complete
MGGRLLLPSYNLGSPPPIPQIPLKVPSAKIPSYKPMVVPPSDLQAPKGVEAEKTEEQPAQPSLKLPVIDIQLPLPTAEVVMTATYAAVAAVATTTLATPFFDQIKKKLTKFLQGKVNKWKETRKKKKDSSVS